MKSATLALVLVAATPTLAAADGWIHCSGPDAPSCNVSGETTSGGVGASLALIGAVVYSVRRRRRQ